MINISPIKGKGKVITTEYKESEFYVRLVWFTWNEEYGQRLRWNRNGMLLQLLFVGRVLCYTC